MDTQETDTTTTTTWCTTPPGDFERRKRKRKKKRKGWFTKTTTTSETTTQTSARGGSFFSGRRRRRFFDDAKDNRTKTEEDASSSSSSSSSSKEEEDDKKDDDGKEEGTMTRSMMREVFTCPITREVFVEPTTLRCGHTFSKTSLVKWMAKKRCCPTCRTSARVFDEDELSVNKVVEEAIELLVVGNAKGEKRRRDAAGRGSNDEEEKKRADVKMKRLPLFALDAIVPGTELTLNVFEPKLRLMIQTVLTQHYNPSFVMCARTMNGAPSNGGGTANAAHNNRIVLRTTTKTTTTSSTTTSMNTIAKYGIIARIIAAQETVDGRFLIRIRADSEKVVAVEKTNNNVGRRERRMSESDDGGEGNENENEEEEEEEEFPICFYTECKDAPWSPLTERLAGSAEEAKASLLLSVDEAEATFYAWATLAEKRGFFGSHACFAHDDCISGCEGKSRIKKDRQRRRKWTTRKQQQQQQQHRQCNRTPDESTEDERERNAPLSEVVFEWKPSLEDNRNDDTDGELERLNDINNERDYDLAFDGGNASSFRRQQLVTRFKHIGGGGINNLRKPSFEDVRLRPEQFASVLLWWFVRCVNPIPSARAAVEIRPSMLRTGDAKTRFSLFSKLISVSIVRVLGYAPFEWMNWECVKEKRLMKKIGEVLSKERNTLSAATIKKEEIGKDDANRRKVRLLIETCLSILCEYSKEEKDERQRGDDADAVTGIPTVSGVRIVFTDEELESFGCHKLALALRDALLKVAHKKKNDRHAQRKRVQNLRALAKALKHNLHETEFFQMFDPFCHDLTARRSNSYLYFTSNSVDGIMCNVKRIRIMAKGRRFVYQTISFIRGVSFGAKLAYEKLFWVAGLILFSLVILASIVQALKFIHRFGPSQDELQVELRRLQTFARGFVANVFWRAE